MQDYPEYYSYGNFNVITGFDGSCPFSQEGISLNADGILEIKPSWRPIPGISEEAPGGGSRFSVKVENRSNGHEIFRCYINWEDDSQKILKVHDWFCALFPGAGEAWITYPAQLHPPGTNIEISLPPGVTHLGMSPYYGYDSALKYLRGKAGISDVEYNNAGTSKEGREIPVLVLHPAQNRPGIPEIIIMSRNHAYESAGNFCCEGMIDFLTSGVPEANSLRRRYRFHFMPMTNPDGVYNGMSRLTSPHGADLNRCRKQDDASWQTIKNYIDAVRPALFLNIHNWMNKDTDGLLGNTKEFTEKFARLMPDMRNEGKHWYREWIELYLEKQNLKVIPETSKSWKDYVMENFDGIAVCLEFPWFGRSCQRMREIGRQSLKTFIAVSESMKHKLNYSSETGA